jgi:hypothetical protein
VEEAKMTVKIPLRLRGIDLRDVEAYDRIDPGLDELFWEANGGVSLAVMYSDESVSVAVRDAVDWARRIAKLMPGVTVADVHDELVSISDIAARAGVAAEAVRLWAAGKRRTALAPFPAPHQVVGGGSGSKTMSLYAWREVVSWVREIIGTDPDEGIEYLTDAQLADLNAEVATIMAAPGWQPMSIDAERIIADVQQMCATGTALASTGSHLTAQGGDASSAERALKLRVGFLR